jgi:hypothetical protein
MNKMPKRQKQLGVLKMETETTETLLSISRERNYDLEEMIYNMMKELRDPDEEYYIGRYRICINGTVYDTKNAKDIPNWVFELNDLILNYIPK